MSASSLCALLTTLVRVNALLAISMTSSIADENWAEKGTQALGRGIRADLPLCGARSRKIHSNHWNDSMLFDLRKGA